MQTLRRMLQQRCCAVLLVIFISILSTTASAIPQAPNPTDVPVVKGGAGSCTADFLVKDSSGRSRLQRQN